VCSSSLTTPRCGSSGGERIVGDLRLAALITLMSVLLPTFGNPTRATSAISFSSSFSHVSSPCSPCSAKTAPSFVRPELGVAATASTYPMRPANGRRDGEIGQQLPRVQVGRDGALGYGDLHRLASFAV
jgi:hypothetical protein